MRNSIMANVLVAPPAMAEIVPALKRAVLGDLKESFPALLPEEAGD